MGNHQYLWFWLSDWFSASVLWARQNLNGRGGFSKSEPLHQSLGFLLPECLCFQRGFLFLLGVYITMERVVAEIHGPFRPPHSETSFFSFFKTSKGGGNHNFALKRKPSESKAFMIKKDNHSLDSTSLIYSELSTVNYVAFLAYLCQKLTFLWPG